MRRAAAFIVVPLALASCAPDPFGPTEPIAVEQLSSASAFDAAASRQAVMDFVDAYARSPVEGPAALANLVVGNELASWVRWLNVQHREFRGTIDSATDVRAVEFLGTFERGGIRFAQVGLSGSVTFQFVPEDAAAFERARVLDGPVTLVRTEAGTYQVVDLLRDGLPMSSGIQVFEEQTVSDGPVRITLDSLFLFAPNWQFNLVITNLGHETLTLDAEASGLFVDSQRVDGVLTGSLATIPPGGTIEGIAAYPSQDAVDGRVLALAYADGAGASLLEFALEEVVTGALPPAPTDEGAEGDVTR